MSFRFSIVVLAVVQFGGEALPQDPLQEILLSHEKKLVEAIKQKDRAALEVMLADEEFAVTPEGGRKTGAQMLESLDSVTLDSYRFSEVKLVKASDDVGILTYKFHSTGSRNGKPFPATTAYATSIWALRDGRWKSVFYQETRVKE